jgi:hypothetical protein
VLAGHYAPALGLKALFPKMPLWLLFVGVQAVDIAWGLFVLTGVEVARIQPGFKESNGLVLEQVVYSHSLVGALAWGIGLGALVMVATGRKVWAFAMGVAVASHWLLDLPMHMPDLPFSGAGSPKFGFGLWQSRPLSVLAEAAVLAVGGGLWRRGPGASMAPRPRLLLAGWLMVLAVAGYYGPQPESIEVTAGTGLLVYGAMGWLAWRLENTAVGAIR